MVKEYEESEGERRKQLSELSLKTHLKTDGWCQVIAQLLSHFTSNLEDSTMLDHDSIEKIVNSMTILSSTCDNDFVDALSALKFLNKTYANLAREEVEQEDGSFFQDLAKNINNILSNLLRKHEL